MKFSPHKGYEITTTIPFWAVSVCCVLQSTIQSYRYYLCQQVLRWTGILDGEKTMLTGTVILYTLK